MIPTMNDRCYNNRWGIGGGQVLRRRLIPVCIGISALALGACGNASDENDQICLNGFSKFEELPLQLLSFPTGHLKGIRDPIFIYSKLVDIDNDGVSERIYLSNRGDERGQSTGPYSVLFVVDSKNPAYQEASLVNVSKLHDVSIIRNAENYDFEYVSFANGFQSVGLTGGKSKNEAWSPLDFQEYLQGLGLFGALQIENLPPFESVIARVGQIEGDVFFHLNVKPLLFNEDGNRLVKYNDVGSYVGPRYEFLARYDGVAQISLICSQVNENSPDGR